MGCAWGDGCACGEAAPGAITSQRTQTAQVGGQPIAMSEKSSNFAAHLSKESKAALRPRDEEALRNR